MAYHKLLQRQLKKYEVESLLSNDAFLNFAQAISDSYRAFDRDKELSDHAFMVSQEEFTEINSQLSYEVELRKLSIQKLKDTLDRLKTEKLNDPEDTDLDVLEIVEMLNQEIAKRKEAEAQLLSAKSEAENANRVKSEFLSVVSHELRTPLNAVIGMGHLLSNNEPRPDQRENLNALSSSADTLLMLINDILDFNKIEMGKADLQRAPFDLRRLMKDIVNSHSTAAASQGNSLIVDLDDGIPEMLIGDQLKIGQVLNNLISNAIKFTKNGTVTISIKIRRDQEDLVVLNFAIKDTGVGIPRQNQSMIFEPFTQVSTSITRQYGGTGLGLAIIKRILTLMDSEINVESILGKGSTFHFLLRLKPFDDDNKKQKARSTEKKINSANILLVEDTPFNVLYAIQLLEGWSFNVDVAENGAIAVHKVKNRSYDLILMDLQMPIMDGYTAAATIRNLNIQVPIIALTASASNNVGQKVRAVGMQDFLTKPYNPDDLLKKISHYL